MAGEQYREGSGGGFGFGGGGGGFWLPPELLTAGDDDYFLPRGVSPNDSSDEEHEDEYMAGLTREMAHFFLLHDEEDNVAAAGRNAKVRDVSGTSPQSTLCAMNYLSASGRDTPRTLPAKAATAAPGKEEDPWSLLYQAADQVMRMQLQDQAMPARKLPPPQRLASSPALASKDHFAGGDQAAASEARRRQLQAAQFHALRQQQLLKRQQMVALWQKQSRARGGAGRTPGQSPATWPPLQKPQQQQAPQPGTGMRAAFLAGAKKESAGTGVFLPRRPGAPSESRKKPACSTVLLPARVVQALNLDLDELRANPRFPGGFVLDHGAFGGRNNTTAAKQKRGHHNNVRTQTPPVAMAAAAQELRLPQEWTY